MRLRRHSEMRESERTEKGAKASGVLTLQSQWLSGSIASSMFFLTRVHALTTGRQSGMFPQHECDCNGRQTCTARTLLCQSTETILENKRVCASLMPDTISQYLTQTAPMHVCVNACVLLQFLGICCGQNFNKFRKFISTTTPKIEQFLKGILGSYSHRRQKNTPFDMFVINKMVSSFINLL